MKSSLDLVPALIRLLLLPFSAIAQSSIINGVRGLPNVTCGDSSIVIRVETESPFLGSLYTKGFFSDPSCRVRGAFPSKATAVEIVVPVDDACGTRRKRSVSPRGIILETTVIVQFHRMFLTKVDRSYNVECFYQQLERAVSQSYDVSALPASPLPSGDAIGQSLDEGGDSSPTCKYEVLVGGPSGPPLRYARLGDTVYHKWSCSPSTASFCMTVHSCTVDDGHGTEQRLLDHRGCTLDSFLLSNLEYKGAMEAGQSSSVFRFADRPTVFFLCSIRLEKMQMAGQCTHAKCSAVTDSAMAVTAPVRVEGPIEEDYPRPPPFNGEEEEEGEGASAPDQTSDGGPETRTERIGYGRAERITKAYELTTTPQARGPPGSLSPSALDPRHLIGPALIKGTVPPPGADNFRLDSNDSEEYEVEYEDDVDESSDGRKDVQSMGDPSGHRPKGRKMREQLTKTGTAGMEGRPTYLDMNDLMEQGHYRRSVRMARSPVPPSSSSFDVDVAAPTFEVSDEPLYDTPSEPSPESVRILHLAPEVCLSTLALLSSLACIVLLMLIAITAYWMHVFKKRGRAGKFVQNYWIEYPQ